MKTVVQLFRSVNSTTTTLSVSERRWTEFSIATDSLMELSNETEPIRIYSRHEHTMNWMPFSDRESDWPFSSYRGFGLAKTGFSEKPSSLPSRMTFSLLIGISFYVSSRRSRICVHIERTPNISIHRATREDNLTVQAMTQLIFPWDSLASRSHRRNRLNQV